MQHLNAIESKPLEWQELWDAMDANPGQWVPTTADMYDEMLNVLPPALWIGSGFLVGEPQRHDNSGRPVFAAFIESNGSFFAQYLNGPDFKAFMAG